MICAVKKIPFILFLLCTVLYAQGAQKLTYSIIKELDVEPVSEKNYCGEECGFQLKIPYVKADSVMAAIPDLPSGVSFVSLRRSDYADETSGTKIELWLTFPDAGTYRLRFLRVTINGKFYNIPFKPITIYENPRNMLPQLVVEFDNGTELIRQKNSRQNVKAVFSSQTGTPLYFTVYLQYAVQLVSFYWNIPKNALFTELERYEITKGMLRNSEFSEEKIPVARFEWQPLVTGNAALPEISLTATSYNGSRVELSMPDSYVQIVPPVADENDSSVEETFFAYAFTKLPEKSAVSVKQAVSPDDCRTIATLREKERNELPFGEARRERIAFERQCGIRNAENEPTYFVRNTLICLTIIFAVFLGMAVGAASALIPTYLAELSPADKRGSMSSLFQLMVMTGIFIAYVTNYSFSGFYTGWRWMLGFAAIPAALLFFGALVLPESPRFLVKENKVAEARQILEIMNKHNTSVVDKELSDIKEQAAIKSGGWSELFGKLVRPSLIIGVGLAIFQQVMGCNTVLYYAPTIFTDVGFGVSAALIAHIGIGIFNVIVTAVAVMIMDKIDRKTMLIGGAIGMGVSLFVMSFAMKFSGQSHAAAIICVIALTIYIAFFSATWGPVMWVMIGEVFPLNIRGLGNSFSSVINWSANMVVSLTFPPLLDFFGTGSLFIGYGVLCFAAIWFVHAKVFETRNRSLEDIEETLRTRMADSKATESAK